MLQKSRVLICLDSRATDNPPKWLRKRRFVLQKDVFLPAAPAGSGYGYQVFARVYPGGAEARKNRDVEACVPSIESGVGNVVIWLQTFY